MTSILSQLRDLEIDRHALIMTKKSCAKYYRNNQNSLSLEQYCERLTDFMIKIDIVTADISRLLSAKDYDLTFEKWYIDHGWYIKCSALNIIFKILDVPDFPDFKFINNIISHRVIMAGIDASGNIQPDIIKSWFKNHYPEIITYSEHSITIRIYVIPVND